MAGKPADRDEMPPRMQIQRDLTAIAGPSEAIKDILAKGRGPFFAYGDLIASEGPSPQGNGVGRVAILPKWEVHDIVG